MLDPRLASAKEIAQGGVSPDDDTKPRADQVQKRTVPQAAAASKAQQDQAPSQQADQGPDQTQEGQDGGPSATAAAATPRQQAAVVGLSEAWPLPGASQQVSSTPVSGSRGSPSSTSGEPKQQRLSSAEGG